MARFRARWPLGTRERLALEILATTGLRRGDAARLGRQHVSEVHGETVLRLRTEKGGRLVVREIMPELKAAIDAYPLDGLALIARADGAALSKKVVRGLVSRRLPSGRREKEPPWAPQA